jgi:hypothetical protein
MVVLPEKQRLIEDITAFHEDARDAYDEVSKDLEDDFAKRSKYLHKIGFGNVLQYSSESSGKKGTAINLFVATTSVAPLALVGTGVLLVVDKIADAAVDSTSDEYVIAALAMLLAAATIVGATCVFLELQKRTKELEPIVDGLNGSKIILDQAEGAQTEYDLRKITRGKNMRKVEHAKAVVGRRR